MKILICPDKFKHSLDAASAAAAIADGIHQARPDACIESVPLADGGDGTGLILADAAYAVAQSMSVLDPLGRARQAIWWRAPDGRGIVEMAEASGLALLKDARPDAMRASSYGTGQLLAAAIHGGCTRIDLCVGGSATVDGGAGALQALGWRFIDARGDLIEAPLCGGLLRHCHTVVPAPLGPRVEVRILCDVRNALLGEFGAAAVFAPQKGATPRQVSELELGLRHWCRLLLACTRVDGSKVPYGGAAGGLSGGLHAALGASLVPGFEMVAEQVGLKKKIGESDLILTGEGRLDAQTSEGKVVAGVARMARESGAACVAFVGGVALPPGASLQRMAEVLGLHDIVVVTPPGTPLRQALAGTRENLAACARHFISRLR